MIACIDGLPLVRSGAGKSLAFDKSWLKSTLAGAAVKAGYECWWPVDDLVEGISWYLRHDYASGVIDLAKLENVVRTMLCAVGYKEVALRFHTVMPCTRLSLARCLRQLSQNDQAEFFDKLGEQIARLHATNPQHVHFSDLQACVRGLTKIYPTLRCGEHLTIVYKVVTFVQERVQSLRWHPQVRCLIS